MSANIIDANGISIQTYAEILTDLLNGTDQTPGFLQIYGSDINVDQNSPDGQMINIFALSKQDILNLIVQDYDSKDPDQAVGVALDAIAGLAGLHRQGGTFTRTAVLVTTDRNVNLSGLDNPSPTPYTISDNNGNLFYLIEGISLSAGATSLNFQSATIGFVQISPNTLTQPVTIIPGVVSVNNPDVPFSIGENQETDAAFRLRRQKSTAVPGQGFLQSLFGGLNTLDGLLEAKIYENNTNSTDAFTVPAHSIWVIVDGGTDDDVANMIYRYRNAGCGMKGDEVVNVTQVDGTTFPIRFDRAVYEDLYIQFSLTSLDGNAIDADSIKTYLVENYILGINDIADTTSIIALVKAINPNVLVTLSGVSATGYSYQDDISPTDIKNRFIVTTDKIDITII